MTAAIMDFKGPITDGGLISSLEKLIGCPLPVDYRKFLEFYNGGYPEPDAFYFSNGEDGSSVDRFLSLGCEKHHDLLKYFNTYKDRIPPGFLPIAHDPGGNLILISLNDDSPGIYFWDHEAEADEGEIPSTDNMYVISSTLSEFLACLHQQEL
jgi:cell wall assembly regulator SMI1